MSFYLGCYQQSPSIFRVGLPTSTLIKAIRAMPHKHPPPTTHTCPPDGDNPCGQVRCSGDSKLWQADILKPIIAPPKLTIFYQGNILLLPQKPKRGNAIQSSNCAASCGPERPRVRCPSKYFRASLDSGTIYESQSGNNPSAQRQVTEQNAFQAEHLSSKHLKSKVFQNLGLEKELSWQSACLKI